MRGHHREIAARPGLTSERACQNAQEERVGGAERREGRGLQVAALGEVFGSWAGRSSILACVLDFRLSVPPNAELFAIIRISALGYRAPIL